MKKVGVLGASGYTGYELIKLLGRHKGVELVVLNSESHAGRAVSELYPDFSGQLSFTGYSVEEVNSMNLDLVFLALPHTVSMRIVPRLEARIVDLSADYRFKDYREYERVYGVEHKDSQREAVYGLPELYRREIRKARLVANPGCYATACLLASLPINDCADYIVFDCKSGYSGAGKNSVYARNPNAIKDNLVAYSLTRHRHVWEMRQFLRPRVGFTPHVVGCFRGLMATVHVALGGGADAKEAFDGFFGGEPFVRIVERAPELRDAQNTNYCFIGGFEKDDNNRLVVVSVLDNLLKGAAGQAVQNMNLMLGFPETEGLK
jgi:N-acetyl-gamma-glutamyl-phosphate reductase